MHSVWSCENASSEAPGFLLVNKNRYCSDEQRCVGACWCMMETLIW